MYYGKEQKKFFQQSYPQYSSERPVREWHYSELYELNFQLVETEANSRMWHMEPASYNPTTFFVSVKPSMIPLELWLEKREKQTDNTITIHHVKSERIEIIELSPAQISNLTAYDYLLIARKIKVSDFETQSHFYSTLRISFSDFTNHRIIESPET